VGLASHANFHQNHFVYVSFLARERPDRTRLRIVRLREVGDLLGEPAALFESPVYLTAASHDGRRGDAGLVSEEGPRMAFGPDRLLYIALPTGVEFDGEPAASRPHASMIRLSDDGRLPAVGPLSGLSAHPLAFTWHPSTGGLLVVVPDGNGDNGLQPIPAARRSGVIEPDRVRQMTAVTDQSSGAWAPQRADSLELARAFVRTPKSDSHGIVRLTMPMRADSLVDGVLDRVGDIVVDRGGTLFVATNNTRRVGAPGVAEDVIVRLTPLKR
jgi:hypothetical protein